MNFYVEGYADEIFHSSEKINIVYSFTCNIQCAHCIVEGGPHNKEKFALDKAKDILYHAALNGKKMVVLTGGEIFLFYDELLELIKCAKKYNFYIAVETNGFWAINEKKVKDTLSTLKQLGLNEIYTSADAFHMQFVPIENIILLRKISHELNLICEINFYRSGDEDYDQHILHSLGYDVDNPEYFTETLSVGGRDVSSYLAADDFVYPYQLEENNSSFMNFLPNGDVFYNVDTNKNNSRMKKSKLFLGNLYNISLSDIFESEKNSKVLQLIKKSVGTDLHNRFIECETLKTYYLEKYGHNKYLTLSEYYTDVLSDDFIVKSIEAEML